jgi:hypothetical protein
MKATFAALAGVLPVFLFLACYSPRLVGGRCYRTADCHTNENKQAVGSECNEVIERCSCPPGTEECCPDGVLPPGVCAFSCAPEDACTLYWREEDAGVDAPPPPPPLPPECTIDSDCEQPMDARCGEGACVDGKCELTIEVGPLKAQLYGDCFHYQCNVQGEVLKTLNAADFYNDGNECTFDYCKGIQSVNQVVLDGTSCLSDSGYCYEGECVECVDIMPEASCGEGLACDGFWCESFADCNGGACGGICAPCGTGAPCGVDADCISSRCEAGTCALASCSDGRKNANETGIDCGKACGIGCPDGDRCAWHNDCASGVCKAGICQAPTCFDMTQNGGETSVDCGGECDPCL